jgi:hypothetical protein
MVPLTAAFGWTVDSRHKGDARLQRALVETQDAVVDGCGQFTEQRGIEAEPSAQLEGASQDPLSQRDALGRDVVDDVRRSLGHAPAQARRAEAAPLATQSDHVRLGALLTDKQSGASTKHSAIEEAFEFLLDEVGQRCRGEPLLDSSVESLEVVADE